MALVKFSQKEQQLGQLNDNSNSEDYNFDNKFEYDAAFLILTAHISLETGSTLADKDTEETEIRKERPIGNKEAKKRKAGRKKEEEAEEKSVKCSVQDLFLSIQNTNQLMESKLNVKQELAKRRLEF